MAGPAILGCFLNVVRAQAAPEAPAQRNSNGSTGSIAATLAVGGTPAAPRPNLPARGAPSPPAGLTDISAWLDYQSRGHIAALPEEARLFYRKGLLLEQSGARDEAVRMVRGASVLDPNYVAPHLTIASWFFVRDPSQALLQYAAVLDLARQNFILQLALVANLLYLALQALFLGLLAAAFLTVWVHHRELRHGWHERLGRFLTPGTARLWSWGFLILPFFAGLGIALPTVAYLGLLWPSLKASGRALFLTLVLALGGLPWIAASLDQLAAPLREDRGPYWGVALLENEPYTSARRESLGRLAREHPNNPFLQFGLGWMARRGGDLAAAEAAYRHTLTLWPQDDRVMSDLGNTLAMEGRVDEALDLYRRATAANPSNAAAWFNASQIYTQRYDYHAATDALSRASALNFDMVKVYQSRATDDGALPLVDQWLAPRTFWTALSITPAANPGSPTLPPSWRSRLECSGLPFALAAVLLAIVSVALGIWQHAAMPLRTCSNCGDVVCRRCARRRRELALCEACASVESRAESQDFGRVLLLQHRRAMQGHRNLLRTALATLIPGYGLIAFRRVFGPLVLLVWTAALAGGWLGMTAPFSYEARLTLADGELPLPVLVGMWVLLYAVSMMGYFSVVGQANAQASGLTAPVRVRPTQATRRNPAAAA